MTLNTTYINMQNKTVSSVNYSLEMDRLTQIDLEQTLALLDIQVRGCKSIIIKTNGRLVLSQYTTNQLIAKFKKSFKDHIVDDSILKGFYLMNYGFESSTRQLPLLGHQFILMPLSGNYHHSGSWIMVHHIDHHRLSEINYLKIKINNHDHELHITMNTRLFQNNYACAMKCYSVLKVFNKDLCSIYVPERFRICSNISPLKLMKYFVYVSCYENLKSEFDYSDRQIIKALKKRYPEFQHGIENLTID